MNEFEYEETLKDFRREGRQEGLEEGRKEGHQKGLQEGRKEGEARKALEIARSLKAQGVADEVIKTATGVDAEQLQ